MTDPHRRDVDPPPSLRVVSLEPASEADSSLLSNLLELYIHDMSEVFPHVQLGPDGRFGYSTLPFYWSEPDRRFAFLIRCDGRVAGFILATRGSPVVTDPNVLDVAEFFVLRQYRRGGRGARRHLCSGIDSAARGSCAYWRRTAVR